MKSYLKFLSRNKLYTTIEAVGLVLSLAFVIILGSYAWQQYAAAHSTPDGDRVYALGMPDYLGLTYGMPELIRERVPEVEAVGIYCPQHELQMKNQDEMVQVTFVAVNEDFFRIFSNICFVEGSAAVLESKDNAIVSRSFATRHRLGMGDMVKFTDGNVYVAAIVDDMEASILPNVDFYVSDRHPLNNNTTEDPFDHFGNTIPFLKVMPGTDRKLLYDKLEDLCKEVYPDFYGEGDFFDSLAMPCANELFFLEECDTSLNQGDAKSIRMLLLVGLLLLLSAVFNYINLNFALAGKRTKEMAVRRLVGATETKIRLSYWAESVLFTAVCFVLALLVAYALAPEMNTLLNDPNVPIRIAMEPKYMVVYGLLVLVVGTLAGLQPAQIASRIKPVEVMKGGWRRVSKMRFNKVFVVIQSVLTVFLIALALVMECQYHQSLHRPQHARTADFYYLVAPYKVDRQLIGDALLELPCVSRIGFCQGVPGVLASGQYSPTVGGKEIMYRLYRVDSAAFRMLEPQIVEDFHAPLYNSVWFGRKAFEATGFTPQQHDVSQTLATRTRGCEQVAGIIEEWVTSVTNLGGNETMVLSVQRTEDIVYGGWLLETTGDHAEAKAAIAGVVRKLMFEEQTLLSRSGYLDDLIAENLRPQRNAMRLVEIFMLLSILISLLGLLAISSYYADENAKGIAIRKVFGGTVSSESWRTVREYMLLVVVACVIGIPIAVWAAQRYLEGFVVKLEHYGWIFAVAVLLTLAMAFLSVLWQTLRAARTNPASALKNS